MNQVLAQPKEMNKTLIIFRIIYVAHFIFSLLLFFLLFLTFVVSDPNGEFRQVAIVSFVLSLVFLFLGILYYKVCSGLKSGKFWAWIAGIILSGMWCPSIFFFIGIPALWGLVCKNTRTYFFASEFMGNYQSVSTTSQLQK